MSTIVVGLYKETGSAKKAFQALIAAGCQETDIETFGGADSADKAAQGLLGHGFEKELAEQYGAAVRQGHTLVAADIADNDADAAEAILDENGAIDLPEASAGRKADNKKAGNGGTVEQETLQSVKEEVEIGKRRVAKGGMKLTSEVTETPVRDTVTLRDETVDVEHRKVDRALSSDEEKAAFGEKTVELTATTETPEITKEARVVEEVVLSKTASEREQAVEATARRTDVKVEPVGGKSGNKR
ncbi:YsnF/AvaK domain-containing protein [Azospirillum sp.]|uniref:YsnF/AvaK domain-containing protein n=1 Tax=Azospirillum sp. TaxID=34012 RepID=UPI002D5600C4|nr:YsnF/AvaK domain-containing protein [Azospirillum sp.]HYF86595.1 YsnF/AvaK domain-containing protein [Azospirillum sp.]